MKLKKTDQDKKIAFDYDDENTKTLKRWSYFLTLVIIGIGIVLLFFHRR